jgi:hypothetical protein
LEAEEVVGGETGEPHAPAGAGAAAGDSSAARPPRAARTGARWSTAQGTVKRGASTCASRGHPHFGFLLVDMKQTPSRSRFRTEIETMR